MSKIIRTLIIDDNPDQRKILKPYLQLYPEMRIVGEAEDARKARQMIEQLYPDVIFVDIELPGISGIDLVKRITRQPYHPLIVFFRSCPQYAVEGYEIDAIDYLVKPLRPERLKKTIEKIKHALDGVWMVHEPPRAERDYLQYLSIMFNDHSKVVNVDDIVYFSVAEGTVFAHLRKFSGPIRYRSIKKLESELDPKKFIRIHRKYLINVIHIKEIVNWFKHTYHIIMNDDKESELPLSRRGTKELRKVVRW